MELNLSGKIALVTGSSRGIGLHIAKMLIAEGCKLILNGRDSTTLEEITQKIPSADYVVGDVTTKIGASEVIKVGIALHGKVDILVCNVGSGASVPPGIEDE